MNIMIVIIREREGDGVFVVLESAFEVVVFLFTALSGGEKVSQRGFCLEFHRN